MQCPQDSDASADRPQLSSAPTPRTQLSFAPAPRPKISAAARVQRWLRDLQREDPEAHARIATDGVVVGLSGGADSLALTIGAVRAGLAVHAVVVDHQLQQGSAEVAARAAEQALSLGAASAEVIQVTVAGSGEGPARAARYEALGRAAAVRANSEQSPTEYSAGARGVLVAHTAADDAEGFLVALSRGSGTDALSGMRPFARRHPVVTAGAAWIGRPLLGATRADAEAECALAGVEFWQDPHNFSRDYVRSRVRQELLPHAEGILGSALRDNLARSARLLREDADALDDVARGILRDCAAPGSAASAESSSSASDPASATASDQASIRDMERGAGDGGLVASLQIGRLEQHAAALRRRVIKHWLATVAGPLTNAHIEAIDTLVANWRGQGPVSVPWPVDSHTMNKDRRTSHRLVVRRADQQLQIDEIQRQPDSEGR